MMQMIRAACKRCGYVHDIVTAPMPLTTWARAASAAHCPMCGNRDGNTVAEARDLTEAETVAKTAALAIECGDKP